MPNEEKHLRHIEIWVGVVATFVVALFGSIAGGIAAWQLNFAQGKLEVYPPTEFCVRRGLRAFPSDHLILPMNIENTGKGAKTLELPTLYFTDPSVGEISFVMRGFIPALDTYSIDETFETARGIAVPERTLVRYILVFQPQDATNPSSENFTYRFDERFASDRIGIRLVYLSNGSSSEILWEDEESKSHTFVSIPYASAFNNLQLPLNIGDFWDEAQYPSSDFGETGTYNTECFSTRHLRGTASGL